MKPKSHYSLRERKQIRKDLHNNGAFDVYLQKFLDILLMKLLLLTDINRCNRSQKFSDNLVKLLVFQGA
ncbi:hypothetical protein PMIT1342_00210 [Prochlorococcus marinus str. MIT 1342]|nr:hypothetical protein PMIT1342_00210 [Prochlorococcus marinus str. MIT 1342]